MMNTQFSSMQPKFSATLQQKREAREMLMDTVIERLPDAIDTVNNFTDRSSGNPNSRGFARLAIFNAAAALLANDPELALDHFSRSQ